MTTIRSSSTAEPTTDVSSPNVGGCSFQSIENPCPAGTADGEVDEVGDSVGAGVGKVVGDGAAVGTVTTGVVAGGADEQPTNKPATSVARATGPNTFLAIRI